MKTRRLAIAVSLIGLALAQRTMAQQPDGQAVYREECKSCHGINGVPPANERAKYKKLRSLGDSGFVSSLTVDSIVKILKKGMDKNMKSFAEKLDDGELRAVALYIKELAEKLRAKKP
jgi:mono/diheme cytochrome c family protein